MALVMCLSLVQVTAFAEENVYIADDMVQNEIVPCTHEWSQWVETQAATCTETGVKTLACALCSTLITDVVETEDLAALEKTGEIPASGHSYVDGVCERCGAEDPDHPKACVHSWGEWAVTKPATEEETGEEARICSVCGDVETQTTGKLEPQPPVEEPVSPEVQAFLDAVYALYDASEEQMLQAVEYAGMLYNALTGEQKALEEVYQCKYALDAFRETMTLEEPGEDTVNDESSLKEAVIKGGSVKLGDNITLTRTLEISNTVTLDLNGNTLTGNGKSSVIKVTGSGTIFTLKDSGSTGTVTGGRAKEGSGVYVGGGTAFVMTGGRIFENAYTSGDAKGGGVYVAQKACFELSGNASVSNNTAQGWGGDGICGGGVYVGPEARFKMSGTASVDHNTNDGGARSAIGGGVYVDRQGTFEMCDNASVFSNTARNTQERACYGGGVYVGSKATFTMSGNAKVSDNIVRSGNAKNAEDALGGGICAEGGIIKVSGNAAIQNNVAESLNTKANGTGGGIALWYDSTMTMEDSANISNNTAKGWFGGGISLHWSSTLEMTGGTISDNDAGWFGGGIATWANCKVILRGDDPILISNNTCEGGFGGGIGFNGPARVVMENGVTVSGNSAKYGGGVGIGECGRYGDDNASDNASWIEYLKKEVPENMTSDPKGWLWFEMRGGLITGNQADYGGGVDINICEGLDNGWTSGTFEMSGDSVIKGNTATKLGGGISNGAGVFRMSGNAELTGNTAPQGGAIYVGTDILKAKATVYIASGTITQNTATTGGGIYVMPGSHYWMPGGELDNNTATTAGADIYSDGGDLSLNADMTNWTLDANHGGEPSKITGWFFDGVGCTKADCTTSRWSTSADKLHIHKLAGSIPNSPIALKAAYGKLFILNYDANGGTGAPVPTTGEVNGSTASVAVSNDVPTRDGYRFLGWSTSPTGSVNYTGGSSITLTGDVMLYAVWEYVGGYNPPIDFPLYTPPTPTTTITPAPTPTAPGTTIADEETPLAGSVGLNDTDHFAYVIGYDDDTVRPLNNITRAEAATIFFRLMTDEYRQANWSTTNSFSDVNAGDWYNNAVSTCANAGVLKGYEDGTFRPNAPITRAEFAAMAAGFMDESITDDGTGDFSDTANHWAAVAIRRAAKAGWVTGSGNKFNPDAKITRAEVMTIVNRMLDRTPEKDHMLPEMKKWTDNPESEWYYEAVQEATNEHEYERDELNVETWTELLTERDWKALETEWANNGGASAPKADDTEAAQRMNRVPDGI